jgi:hypothetical protein
MMAYYESQGCDVARFVGVQESRPGAADRSIIGRAKDTPVRRWVLECADGRLMRCTGHRTVRCRFEHVATTTAAR